MSIIASFAIILVYLCMIISTSNVSNYMMPFTALTIIVAVFTTPVTAFVTTMLLLGLISAVLFLDSQLFMCFTIVTVSAVYCVSNICYSKRFDLIKCGFQAGAILFVCTIVSAMLENQLKIGEVGAYLLIALLTSVLTGIIALLSLIHI